MHHLFCDLQVEPLSHVPFHRRISANNGSPRRSSPRTCLRLHYSLCAVYWRLRRLRHPGRHRGLRHHTGRLPPWSIPEPTAKFYRQPQPLVCASTAAGPAFEAGSIRMGMRAVTGAIALSPLCRRAARPCHRRRRTSWICGTGLVDAVAAGLPAWAPFKKTAALPTETKIFPIAPPVVLYQSDIPELQFAKGAIAAGFAPPQRWATPRATLAQSILLAHWATKSRSIPPSASASSKPRVRSSRPQATALRGAKMLLLTGNEPPLPPIEHVSLAADPGFQDEFANCMAFPEYDKIRMEIVPDNLRYRLSRELPSPRKICAGAGKSSA